jgi:hypothetical protein
MEIIKKQNTQNLLTQPILSPLVTNRLITGMIVGFSLFQVIVTHFNLPGWSCPIKAVLGIPCPGCGLSTAISLLLSGNWAEAIKMHAFAPIFLGGILFLGITFMLSRNYRDRLVSWLDRFERKTGFVLIILISAIFYWLVRLFVSSPVI